MATVAGITGRERLAVQGSVTVAGKRLALSQAKPHVDVSVAYLSAKGPRLSTPRQLTFDEADDLPFDWTLDNKAVLFTSDRTGTTNIFQQSMDETSAEMLIFDREKKSSICRLSPDG